MAGYVNMRIALVLQWLRAERGSLERRRTCLRYAIGIVIVQLGWVALIGSCITNRPVCGVFVILAVAEVLATLCLVHLSGHAPSLRTAVPFGAAVLLIRAGTFIPYPNSAPPSS